MSKKKKSTKPASPQSIANAQMAASTQAAQAQQKMNMIDEVTPFGSVTYNPLGDGRYSRTISLDPQQQQILNLQNQTQIGLGQTANNLIPGLQKTLGQGFDIDPVTGDVRDYSADRQRVADLMFSQLNPQIDRERDSIMSRLAAQGVTPGSAAYSRAMQDFDSSVAGQRTNVLLNAGQEQNRLMGLRTQARNQSLNELNALLGGTQVEGPQYGAAPQVGIAAPDMASLYNNNYQQQLARQQAKGPGVWGTLANIGSSILGGWGAGGFRL